MHVGINADTLPAMAEDKGEVGGFSADSLEL
jgi:hypothetical protein